MGVSLETLALAKKYTRSYVSQHGGGGGGSGGETAKGVVGTVSIGSGWSGSGPYTQTVVASGYEVTDKTCVDLIGDDTSIGQMIEDGVCQIYISNNNGTLTAYAIGGKTTSGLTFQAIFSEVS